MQMPRGTLSSLPVNHDKNAPVFLSAETGILEDCMNIVEALEKHGE